MRGLYLSIFVLLQFTGCDLPVINKAYGSSSYNNETTQSLSGLIDEEILGSSSSNNSTSSSSCPHPFKDKNGLPDIDVAGDIKKGKVTNYTNVTSQEEKFLLLLNYIRSFPIKCVDSKAVKGPSANLELNLQLINAAKEHSEDMATTGKFSHDGSGSDSDITAVDLGLTRGSKFYERVRNNGFNGTRVSENIAKVSTSSAEDVEMINTLMLWLKSRTGHCSNMLDDNMAYVGVAKIQTESSSYWTVDFGK